MPGDWKLIHGQDLEWELVSEYQQDRSELALPPRVRRTHRARAGEGWIVRVEMEGQTDVLFIHDPKSEWLPAKRKRTLRRSAS